jgi:hypothetical protein
LELARYENVNGETVFRFVATAPPDASTEIVPRSRIDVSTVDTVVVPAREDGLTFLKNMLSRQKKVD